MASHRTAGVTAFCAHFLVLKILNRLAHNNTAINGKKIYQPLKCSTLEKALYRQSYVSFNSLKKRHINTKYPTAVL